MSKLFLIALSVAAFTLTGAASPANSQSIPAETTTQVRYRTVEVDGTKIFYREAGASDAPTIVLLHGFPSSSHMFRDLIPRLADRFRVIAPDYPGFGYSDAPAPGDYVYTFDNLARTMDRFLETVGASRYVLYMQDYGGPIGFRIATAHPERVVGLVAQNANVYNIGFGAEARAPLKGLWEKGRSTETEAPARALFSSPEAVKFHYATGARNAEAMSPDSWMLHSALFARPGQDNIQLSLLEDYKTNLDLYPKWQAYLRKHKPKTLVAWGKNDPIFGMPSAEAFRRDVPDAEIVLLNTGHFALEEEAPEIAALIQRAFKNPAQ